MTVWLSRFANCLGLVCALLSGTMVLINALLICFEITMRKFGHPTSWAIECTVYLTIWAVYLGIVHVEAEDGQIRMAILRENLSGNFGRVTEGISSFVAVVFLSVLIWFSAEQALNSLATGRATISMLRIPTVFLESAVPIGGVLVLGQVLIRALTRIGRHAQADRSALP